MTVVYHFGLNRWPESMTWARDLCYGRTKGNRIGRPDFEITQGKARYGC